MDRNLRIRMIFEALDRVTKPLRDIAGAGGKAGKELADTRQRLQQLQTTARDVSGFRRLKGELTGTRGELDQARQRASELGRQLSATANPTRALAREFDRAKREIVQLEAREREQVRTLGELRQRLDGAGVSTKALATHERRLRGDIEDTTRALEEQSTRLDRAAQRRQRLGAARERFGRLQGTATGLAAGGASGIATGYAISRPLQDSAADAMSFEDSMADVRKVVDGLDNQRAFRRMSDDILNLSKRLPMTGTELAAIVAAGGQSGIQGRSALLAYAEDAAKMGIAFDIAADEAGSTMAKWRSAFAMGREQVLALADQVNYLGNTSAANAPLITEIVTRIGPLGEVGGLAAGEIAALGATLGGMGIESEIAATGIKNTMLALTKGPAATKAQSAAFRSLGLDASDVARRMQQDAATTIVDVMRRLGALPKELQAGTLTKLFGSESVAAIAPLLTQLPQLRENFAKAGDASRYAGSMEAEYASRAATTSNAVQMSTNRFQALKITLGTALFPIIQQGSEMFGRLSNRVEALAKRHPNLSKAIMVGLGVFAALFTVIGGLAIVIAGLIAPFAALAFVAGAFNIAMLPTIGIALAVVAGIVALGAAAYLLYSNWGRIAAFFSGLWDGIKATFFDALGAIGRTLSSFSPLTLIAGGIFALLNWLTGTVGTRLFDIGRNLIAGLIRGVTSMLSNLKSTIVSAATSAADWFRQKLGIRSPSRVFMGYGGDMMDGLAIGLARGERAPVGRMSALTRSLSAALAAGSAFTPIAASASGAPGASQRAMQAAPTSYGPVTININGANRDPRDIASEIERILRNLGHGKPPLGGGSFADRPDWDDE